MNRTPSTATVKPLLAFASVMSALTIAAAQNSQQQRFRAGVDLITVDVTADDLTKPLGLDARPSPVKPGEDARSGRWAGQAKVECGIHLSGLDASLTDASL